MLGRLTNHAVTWQSHLCSQTFESFSNSLGIWFCDVSEPSTHAARKACIVDSPAQVIRLHGPPLSDMGE
ncbi:hypothetical protein PAXRUDRAFT_826184 [Paxillus rubicundulus Ve08.2h10]|uniref:Uncharacterized protein n=1 Tax=Paxillus rubicundulus Ve08.2h10 TaxID=930991 RepID=A0A0D0DS94_9AGAM|nr:hypothetical protein PAXRUDRAFT_826184 [Paxillus rubicundulus Ve08.2h10]